MYWSADWLASLKTSGRERRRELFRPRSASIEVAQVFKIKRKMKK